MQTIKRIVPHDDPVLVKDYSDLMEKMPADVIIVETEGGVYRFKENSLVCWLTTPVPPTDNVLVDLNLLYIAYDRGAFTLEDYMAFYRDMGYSLCGFIEIFGSELWPEEK